MKKQREPEALGSLARQLREALHKIRVGDYDAAFGILSPLRGLVPTSPVELSPTPSASDYDRLRLATLLAEAYEYRGDYVAARMALGPYDRIVEELQEMQHEQADLDRRNHSKLEQAVLRQKLYYLWQRSVCSYRAGAIHRSRELLDLAIDLAEKFQPRSEPLLTQLYYGAGKLAFHEFRENDAIAMYRQSLTSASQRLDMARRVHDSEEVLSPGDDAFDEEVSSARYSVAKILALGLGQTLREQGRLEEAYTQVIAGCLLLNLGTDVELLRYARLLLGSIERSLAGENNPKRLQHASDQIVDCANHFADHRGEVGFRSRLERALVAMQQKRLGEARQMIEAMLELRPDAKWVAECNLALSRIARRGGSHKEAVSFARTAIKAADGLERIRRRAQVVLVLALYDAATDGDVFDDLLKETLREIERAMKSASTSDVRTRANMLLTKARVLKTRGEIARALEVYKEYETLKPLVEVGRILELARTVEKELEPVMNAFRSPADLDTPVYSLKENVSALNAYLVDKVTRKYTTATEQARALSISRAKYYQLLTQLRRRT